ncbi:hypothetical protein BGLA2_1070002 [Burkholderia gladioli]|nr:hypothetical protein BGLA2_1070002 [Burkholderia gladioli]
MRPGHAARAVVRIGASMAPFDGEPASRRRARCRVSGYASRRPRAPHVQYRLDRSRALQFFQVLTFLPGSPAPSQAVVGVACDTSDSRARARGNTTSMADIKHLQCFFERRCR